MLRGPARIWIGIFPHLHILIQIMISASYFS